MILSRPAHTSQPTLLDPQTLSGNSSYINSLGLPYNIMAEDDDRKDWSHPSSPREPSSNAESVERVSLPPIYTTFQDAPRRASLPAITAELPRPSFDAARSPGSLRPAYPILTSAYNYSAQDSQYSSPPSDMSYTNSAAQSSYPANYNSPLSPPRSSVQNYTSSGENWSNQPVLSRQHSSQQIGVVQSVGSSKSEDSAFVRLSGGYRGEMYGSPQQQQQPSSMYNSRWSERRGSTSSQFAYNPYPGASGGSTPISASAQSLSPSDEWSGPYSAPFYSSASPGGGGSNNHSAPLPLSAPASGGIGVLPLHQQQSLPHMQSSGQYMHGMPLGNSVQSHPHGMPALSLPLLSRGDNTRRRGKLPKLTTEFLKDWLHKHAEHPYPSEDEKKRLCTATGLSMSQVSNWMINVSYSFPLTRFPR
jgi:hypothetical protein